MTQPEPESRQYLVVVQAAVQTVRNDIASQGSYSAQRENGQSFSWQHASDEVEAADKARPAPGSKVYVVDAEDVGKYQMPLRPTIVPLIEITVT